jgi:hypothetical protein
VARRADWATAASVSLGVSASLESGVVGRVEVVLRLRSEGGRKRDVKLGEGGSGVGGRL